MSFLLYLQKKVDNLFKPFTFWSYKSVQNVKAIYSKSEMIST